MKRTSWPAALALALALAGCVSVELGGEPPAHLQLVLRDAAQAPVARLGKPIVPALLIQPQPSSALADTLSIAYSRQDHAFAFYQFASWTERPVRQLPHLLQQRLEARGVAGAVGLVGDPMRADWLLAVGVDELFHDARAEPGAARLAMTVDLFDRRSHVRVAHRRFEASAATARGDSTAAAQAMSLAVAQAFDELLPWLEGELQRAAVRP